MSVKIINPKCDDFNNVRRHQPSDLYRDDLPQTPEQLNDYNLLHWRNPEFRGSTKGINGVNQIVRENGTGHPHAIRMTWEKAKVNIARTW